MQSSIFQQWVRRAVIGTIAAAAILLVPARTDAATFGFYCLSSNGTQPLNCDNGEAQLLMDVDGFTTNPDDGLSYVEFYFQNVGAQAMSITQIYFDDNTDLESPGNGFTLGDASQFWTSSAGVSFAPGASPANLPEGNNANPDFVAVASASADAPTQPNGVGPGEWLSLVFLLNGGFDFNDVIAALQNQSLRVGMHVQGFGDGASNTFVNNNDPNDPNVPVVPEPASLLLLGSGLAGVAEATRRRRKAQARS